MPKIDIFVDSPLAVNATSVFRMHPECFNRDIHEFMITDPDPFGFNSPLLHNKAGGLKEAE